MPVKRIRYKNNLIPAPFIGTSVGDTIFEKIAALNNNAPALTTVAPTAGGITITETPVAEQIIPKSGSVPVNTTMSSNTALTPSVASPILTYIIIGIVIYVLIWLFIKMLGSSKGTIVNLNYK